MPTTQQYRDAAATPVADRTAEQKKMVSEAHRAKLQEITNIDFATKQGR